MRCGIHDDVAEFVGQGDEVALRIDDDLLHPGSALLQQAAQEMRLSGPRIALNEQTGGQQLLQIEHGRRPAGCGSHLDINLHSIPHNRVQTRLTRRSSIPEHEDARPIGRNPQESSL